MRSVTAFILAAIMLLATLASPVIAGNYIREYPQAGIRVEIVSIDGIPVKDAPIVPKTIETSKGSSSSSQKENFSPAGQPICDQHFIVDYDYDGFVNLADTVIFSEYYLTNNILADVNADGIVGNADYICMNYYASGLLPFPPTNCELACPILGEPICGDGVQEVPEECDDENTINGDGCSETCQIEERCQSPLDYVDNDGNQGPDFELSLSDAVEFTKYYSANNSLADVNNDQTIDVLDYECAKPYYGNAGPYTCQLECSRPPECVMPIDYVDEEGQIGADGDLTASDAVEFTRLYYQGDLRADANSDGNVNDIDLNCAIPYYGNSGPYECPIACAPCDPANFENADYDNDSIVTLSDTVKFTRFYNSQNIRADIDEDGTITGHDKYCFESFMNPVPKEVYEVYTETRDRTTSCEPRTIGYWKQPCLGHYNHETVQSMLMHLQGVHQMTDVFDWIPAGDYPWICMTLDPHQPATMKERAEQQMLATWFNVVTGKIFLDTEIDLGNVSNATTVKDALNEAASILDSDPERAKTIADLINNIENDNGVLVQCRGGFDCYSPLDYAYPTGIAAQDERHTLADAVIFTKLFEAENIKADVTGDGNVTNADYQCAVKYYGTNTYECPIDCTEFTETQPAQVDNVPPINPGEETTPLYDPDTFSYPAEDISSYYEDKEVSITPVPKVDSVKIESLE